MIAEFNRRQTVRAVVAIFVGLIAMGLTYFFFLVATKFILDGFGLALPEWSVFAIVSGATLVVVVSGVAVHACGEGHTSIEDSDLSLGVLDFSRGGSQLVGHYARRVTGPAYMLSQTFLVAPLQFGRAHDLLKSRLPAGPSDELDVKSTLQFAREQGGWHDIAIYRGREQGVSRLIRMGQLEYSGRRGRVKVAG